MMINRRDAVGQLHLTHRPHFVGGSSTAAGGAGSLIMNSGCGLTVGGTLIVWNASNAKLSSSARVGAVSTVANGKIDLTDKTLVVDYAPGRVGPAHQHPGFVLAYVLEGSVVAKISGQGDEKVYTTGQMFYEQPGATHEVSKNASQTVPAKLLAMIFAKKGSALTRTVGGM